MCFVEDCSFPYLLSALCTLLDLAVLQVYICVPFYFLTANSGIGFKGEVTLQVRFVRFVRQKAMLARSALRAVEDKAFWKRAELTSLHSAPSNQDPLRFSDT